MSLSNLYKFTVERAMILSFELINVVLSHFSLSKHPTFAETSSIVSTKQIQKFEFSNGAIGNSLTREDVQMVMRKLAFSCSNEEETKLRVDEISTLFEEKEPSFDEVKEAFYVFDENKDGFINAEELKTVLCVLGIKDGLDMDKCRMMITRFDENGDEKIDFNEFVKIIEISLV